MIVAFALLSLFAGSPWPGVSEAPHYSHLARAWAQGQLEIDGPPPGYPRAHNDWARVTMLRTTPDQPPRRARRCVTHACQAAERDGAPRETMWWVEGATDPVRVSAAAVREASTRWFVSFPPGPAVLFLPWVLATNAPVPDRSLTLLLAALCAAALVWMLDSWQRRRDARHLWLAGAWLLASPATFVGSAGGVWFTAQILGSLALVLALRAWLCGGLGMQAGVWLAVACACRPHLGLIAPVWILVGARAHGLDRANLRRIAGFLLPLSLCAVLLMLHNQARFGAPLEFGHVWLDVRWQHRMQEYGMFSTTYLARNIQCLLFVPFQFQASWPWVRISIHGIGLIVTAPWIALALLRPRARAQRTTWRILLVSTAIVATLPLLYHNSGQLQVSYRFALDYLPMLIAAIAVRPSGKPRLERLIIAAAVASNLHFCWAFAHHRASLFVARPAGWPFQQELTAMRAPPSPRP